MVTDEKKCQRDTSILLRIVPMDGSDQDAARAVQAWAPSRKTVTTST